MDLPAQTAGHLHERKKSLVADDQCVPGIDLFKVAKGSVIATEQEMIAVINSAVEMGVMKRPASPPGMVGGLIEMNVCALTGEPYGTGKTGKTGANDMDFSCLWHGWIIRPGKSGRRF